MKSVSHRRTVPSVIAAPEGKRNYYYGFLSHRRKRLGLEKGISVPAVGTQKRNGRGWWQEGAC
jgi:hypothetical protein